jgi:hypothetical protein
MAKKYLSLEEAAQMLGMRPDEVARMREKGDLRGFADRGNWKFRSEDIEEALRRRQIDSDPDVNLLPDDEGSLFSDDEPKPRRGSSNSDSDVRLIGPSFGGRADEARTDPDISLAAAPSDSDVRLASKPGSDSDVKLVGRPDSDSDVRLSLSDSDVKLSKAPGSDSDVRLVGGRDAKKPGSDSDVALVSEVGSGDRDFGGSAILDDDDGDSLFLGGDSALRLGGDSGMELGRPADSGILLEKPKPGAGSSRYFESKTEADQFTLAMDSSPKLAGSSDSSKSKKPPKAGGDDLDQTAPMLILDDDEDETVTTTAFGVPLLADDDGGRKGRGRDQTEADVLLFDEDDDLDGAQPTMIRKGKPSFDDDDEFESLSDGSVAELEADEEVVTFDDADDDDDNVFADADEDEMEGSFVEGASAVGMSAGGVRRGMAQEQEWGAATFSLLAVSTVTLAAGAIVAADLMRVVWSQGQTAVYNGALVEMIGGFFK